MYSENNKKIAKNTIMLYLRMLLIMAVSLYTSRVLLNALGIDDYGVYNVVGGVITLFSFITVSMSSATSRFLTYSLGKDNLTQLKKVFKAACTVHLVMAILLLVVIETIGLWFLENKMIIPTERMNAARFVFHSAALSSIFNIIQIPYTASVFSHEKMDVYAYIEIFITLLKLIAVFILLKVSFDQLIAYSFFLVIISLISLLTYSLYTSKYFKECQYGITKEKKIIYPMLSFSSWDLYGNMSNIARSQGVNMLLNIFFGPALNAAYGIAIAIQGAVSSFAGNVLTAIRPQVVKSYAVGNNTYMIKLLNFSAKFTTLLLFIIIIPLIVEMPFVLKIWLKIVPEYTVIFAILTLCFILIANISSIIMSAIHATGKIQRSSLWNGTLYLSVIPLTYISFRTNLSPSIPFILNIFLVVIGSSLNIWYLKIYVPEFSIKQFVKDSILPAFLVGFITTVLVLIPHLLLSIGWLRLISVALTSFTSIITITYFILLDNKQRNYINTKIKKILFNE
jgi:O-antigen/teichoic acid export membrane protein